MDNINKEVYALFYCDSMQSRSTFRLISICDNKESLIKVVENQIEEGKMESEIPFNKLMNRAENLSQVNNNLKYGAIQKYTLNK